VESIEVRVGIGIGVGADVGAEIGSKVEIGVGLKTNDFQNKCYCS
jgi:hypothetical protein